jgi:thioredoxin 1
VLTTQINGPDLVIVDYWATWCGPCKMISPHFAKLEAKFPAIKFAKVDVEEQDVSLPSFLASVS